MVRAPAKPWRTVRAKLTGGVGRGDRRSGEEGAAQQSDCSKGAPPKHGDAGVSGCAVALSRADPTRGLAGYQDSPDSDALARIGLCSNNRRPVEGAAKDRVTLNGFL
jgi:hypothetical protein